MPFFSTLPHSGVLITFVFRISDWQHVADIDIFEENVLSIVVVLHVCVKV